MNVFSRLGHKYTVADIKKAYSLCFRSPSGAGWVLPDLMEFCGVNDPAPNATDMFNQGRAAGRRDVALRIREMLTLTEEELAELWRGRSILKPEDFNNAVV